jgi:hypothetical protein
MSLRRYIDIVTESYDDYDNEPTAPELETHTLSAGTTVYHGTNGKFEERHGLQAPVWVTDSLETAKYFAQWKPDTGKPRVSIWKTNRDVRLAVLTKEYLEYLEEELMINMMDGPEDILQHLRFAGFEGWIIPDNYGTQQADICLDDTSSLDYVKSVRL